MNSKWLFTTLAAAIFAIPAMAEQVPLERTVRMTFMQPVEIPGKVLPAGSYLFEELELGKTTRVWKADGRHLVGTFDTVPFEQQKPAGSSAVLLKKGVDNAPVRIDTWFYQGDTIGSEFVYPSKGEPKKENAIGRVKPVSLTEHGATAVASGLKRLI